jgi:hypothetical protein
VTCNMQVTMLPSHSNLTENKEFSAAVTYFNIGMAGRWMRFEKVHATLFKASCSTPGK